jgi:nucleoside-diphosphate-sugar epimerase
MSKAVVTGGNGYLGTWLIADLLRRGVEVRAVLRSLESEAGLREALRRGGADDAGLEPVVAGLTADDGWTRALAGVGEVYHLASPMHYGGDPEQIVRPARDGALRVLRAARDAGARRVVMTSSFAAIGYSPKPGGTAPTRVTYRRGRRAAVGGRGPADRADLDPDKDSRIDRAPLLRPWPRCWWTIRPDATRCGWRSLSVTIRQCRGEG